MAKKQEAALTAKDFNVAWLDQGKFYFTTGDKLGNGYEICIEACMAGWDVALYRNGELEGEKTCTKTPVDIEEMLLLMEYGEPFTVTGKHLEALEPALAIANRLVPLTIY